MKENEEKKEKKEKEKKEKKEEKPCKPDKRGAEKHATWAVLVKGGKVLGVGSSSSFRGAGGNHRCVGTTTRLPPASRLVRVHPQTANCARFRSYTRHAEGHCLAQLGSRRARGGVMVVARAQSDGSSWAASRPCALCVAQLAAAGVRAVCYADMHGQWVRHPPRPHAPAPSTRKPRRHRMILWSDSPLSHSATPEGTGVCTRVRDGGRTSHVARARVAAGALPARCASC